MEHMEQPFIICGLGRVGWRVLEYLRAAGLPVVVVDTRCPADDPRLGNVRLVKGDCCRSEVLLEAGISHARGVLIMINDDLVNISTALRVRHLHPHVRVVMRLFNQNLICRLGKMINNVYALSTSTLAAPLFALSALTGQALGTIRVQGVNEGLRQVAELTITTASALRGQPVGTVAGRHDVLVLAHMPAGGPDRFLLDVDLETRLLPGDRLILCGEPGRIAYLLEGGEEVLPHVRWAGWLRRMSRVGWRTLQEIDLAVKVCTTVLLAVILSSTLVLHLELPDFPLHKAFYRTISVMATAADMQAEHPAAHWLPVFAAVLRLLGAALVASFTAILTHYLLRARFAGALEFRRIPDSGHVVVCGLGNIGFCVVEQLLRCDARVVVIEQAKDSRFVTTARRLGVPVLIGDATVTTVLQQARAAQARAVVATTSDDLINLEVALLVRDLNPTQRVVLHLSDPNLAQMLREGARVRLALSIPLLAAPAFVAALFGDRVQSVFMVEGRLLVAVDLLIPPGDPALSGQTVRAVAVDYGLLPAAVLDPQGAVLPRPMSARLEAGYRLIAISSLPDLERLFRREPVRRAFAVEVIAFPPPARPRLASLLQSGRQFGPEAAACALDQLPVCVGTNLTRGQAEDLLVLLEREQVTAKVRHLDGEGVSQQEAKGETRTAPRP
jgi:Trk K+ transport system NAD-binding subunit